MKAALAVLGIIACGLMVPALAIRFGDRQTFVSPPDAVIEGFARQIGERRYDMATRYLSASLARTVTAETLRSWFEPQRHALGEVNSVDAEIDWMDRDRASGRAVIEAQRGSVTLRAPLVWDGRGWAIEALPAEVR
jgi:hypothetical protein